MTNLEKLQLNTSFHVKKMFFSVTRGASIIASPLFSLSRETLNNEGLNKSYEWICEICDKWGVGELYEVKVLENRMQWFDL